ncbi:hypothetical protein EUGRSUZ_E02255 [Eucalyptus grandis]|uniref:Uncharacterized protein n=2 Tax=Eucalyptus grandis TaxID=71139 RepID=A0ACC3KXY5_EUCGR|nr:hypothetical protein EUGRSUZ_E02255 [Eucalyptus grandis]
MNGKGGEKRRREMILHATRFNKTKKNMNQLDFIIAKKIYLTIFSICNQFPKHTNYCRGMKRLWSNQSFEIYAIEEHKLDSCSTKNYLCLVIHNRNNESNRWIINY